jgi:hypothetical protein
MINIAQDAKQLLVDFSLYRVPVNPVEVCKKLSIEYDEKPYEGFDGTLLVVGDRQLIGVSSKIKDAGRRAFTCAHELGHAHYDLESAKAFHCTRDDVGHGKQKLDEKEVRANEFASELLMPKDLFLAGIQKQEPSWDLLKSLSKTYQTSLQATANRFIKLTHHTCWLIVVKDGVLHRFTKADHNDFAPHLKTSFKPPKSPLHDFRETFAESWLYAGRKTKNKKLFYCALSENQYGECPVLLWDRGNVLLNEEYQKDEFDEELDRRDDDAPHRRRW